MSKENIKQPSAPSLFLLQQDGNSAWQLTLEPPGIAVYLKQPTGKIYPLLECIDFQGIISNIYVHKYRKTSTTNTEPNRKPWPQSCNTNQTGNFVNCFTRCGLVVFKMKAEWKPISASTQLLTHAHIPKDSASGYLKHNCVF